MTEIINAKAITYNKIIIKTKNNNINLNNLIKIKLKADILISGQIILFM